MHWCCFSCMPEHAHLARMSKPRLAPVESGKAARCFECLASCNAAFGLYELQLTTFLTTALDRVSVCLMQVEASSAAHGQSHHVCVLSVVFATVSQRESSCITC